MRKSSSAVDATAEKMQVTVTGLARLAKIDSGDLHDVSNGRSSLTEKQLKKLLKVPGMPADMKARLAQAFCEDRLPKDAQNLVLVVVRNDKMESSVVSSRTTAYSTLERDLNELRELAKSNPALARALQNMLRVIKGQEVAV